MLNLILNDSRYGRNRSSIIYLDGTYLIMLLLNSIKYGLKMFLNKIKANLFTNINPDNVLLIFN